jgi:hypothetical protein
MILDRESPFYKAGFEDFTISVHGEVERPGV